MLLVAATTVGGLRAQTSQIAESVEIDWQQELLTLRLPQQAEQRYSSFVGAAFDEAAPTLPVWVRQIPISSANVELSATLAQEQYEPMNADFVPPAGMVSEQIEVRAKVSVLRTRPLAHIRMIPIRRNPATGQYERLVSARLQLSIRPSSQRPQATQGRNFASSSVLSSGTLYKIAVGESGVYRIDYAFLQNLGVNMSTLDPRQIQIFGNGGMMLPETVGDARRIDDLAECAIQVVGEADGRFDASDAIIFYAQGASAWEYNSSTSTYAQRRNIYSDESYYFLRIGATTQGKRVGTQSPPIVAPTYTSSAYDALQAHELDEVNLLAEEQPALPPSGREWFGNAFKTRRTQSFSFSFSNRITSEPVRLRARLYARATTGSNFAISQGGSTITTGFINATSTYVYALYADSLIATGSFTSPTASPLNIDIAMNNASSSAEGWLDYLWLQARCQLRFTGGQMVWRDKESLNHNTTEFSLSAATASTQIWDVTTPQDASAPTFSVVGGVASFAAPTSGTLRTFVAFDGSNFRTPNAANSGSISNQNLHAITTPPTLLVVYHPLFQQQAQQLALHRQQHSGISVLAVDVNEIYNEFASGSADLTAIRDFAKMLYARSTPTDSLRYLLLFGAGSHDYKNISGTAGSHNFVPVYQTQESLLPLVTYTSEDYFAMLDDGEGNVNVDDALDIAVGRIPCITASQATQIVNKIIAYDNDSRAMLDWRNMITVVSDDEDSNTHFDDTEYISDKVNTIAPNYNLTKIYCDAYPQQSTGGGGRYPDVNDAILRRLFNGTFILNYSGHGADDGWAQERIFTNTEINSLRNEHKYPLIITATCSFAPHDDPNLTSAGELLLFNPTGGAVALMTTVRVVLANASATLTRNTFDNIFAPFDATRMRTMGEILTAAKNTSGLQSAANSRKFALLGDPSQTLAYPPYRVATTQINGQAPQANLDTLRALQRVTITGEVRTPAGTRASNFNGIIYPTVYDKPDTLYTRRNDPASRVASFTTQNKIIFRGRASVVNGQFSFTFIVPRDINYTLGNGRISYYAADTSAKIDAHGHYNDVIIGGTFTGAVADQQGPEVRVFMNDESFAFGGTTDANPTLLVKLYDENGINTVGNSIGHDLVGELTPPTTDARTGNAIANAEVKRYNLGDSYQADMDSYQRGTVKYPLRNLQDGRHTIMVEAWDVYNNVGRGSTEFIVVSSEQAALQHVLNYPNPFTTSTNFQFDHNFLYRGIDIQVQIFTISGKLVKTINASRVPTTYSVRDIHWDGLDEYGDQLARGTYLYKVTVRSTDGTQTEASEYQKMVILR